MPAPATHRSGPHPDDRSGPGHRGGLRPFGFLPDRVHLDRAEAFAILDAAERVLAGETVGDIVREWNEHGPRPVGGGAWTATTLRRLLRSARIAGWTERDGRLTGPARWPAIIDLEQHIRLRARLGPSGARAGSYALSGFVVCGNCGKTMVARPAFNRGKRTRRYACVADRGGCNRVGIAAQPLEELVSERVLASGRLSVVSARPGRSAAGSIAILEARMDELAEMFGRGDITASEWSSARAAILDRLDEAARSAGAVDAALAGRSLEYPFPGSPPEAVRRTVRAVVVAPTGRPANRFDPDRVSVLWR